MDLRAKVRNMDKRLRVVLISTALLVVAQIGQFMTIAGINANGRESDLAIFFAFATIFIVPSAIILTSAVLYTLRGEWRKHQPMFLLGALNILTALSLTWFFFDHCSWAQIIGIALKGC